MSVKSQEYRSVGIRVSKQVDGKEVGHAYLYLCWNDLHEEPFGLLEDVAVSPEHRGSGVGNELLDEIERLVWNEWHCYKLLATSRTLEASGEDRAYVHHWYERRGFEPWGIEFRKNRPTKKHES